MSDLLAKWFSPNYLRTLLLDPDKSKGTCIQIARFVGAYYLDYFLYLPRERADFPSLYLWGNVKKEDLTNEDTILDRVKVSAMLPVEFSPALPALLMVKCDCLIEAISYVDHFDDRRTSIILRLLADSLHEKDLTIDYIKSMIIDNLPLQIDENIKSNSFSKFSQTFTESILQLDVAMQSDLILFLELHLISSAEFAYSELSLESDGALPNPVYEHPGEEIETKEAKKYAEIFYYVQILLDSYARSNRIVAQLNFIVKLISDGNEATKSRINPNFTLHRVLLLMLRLTYRQLFSSALRENDEKTSKIAERYKILLGEEESEHVLLKNWFETAEDEEMEKVQQFIDLIQNGYGQTSSLPPLNPSTRELWLRRIVLNSTTNHRDPRQERTMDWFRSVCHPKHRVCDVAMTQMLFVNSQWTSPGFTFIQPGTLALRLSIHPHDLCLGATSKSTDFTMSARDVLYSNELEEFTQDTKLFTPRGTNSPDLISKYARKHEQLTGKMTQTARLFDPFNEKRMRAFVLQQDQLNMEVARERMFLNGRTGNDEDYPSSTSFIPPSTAEPNELARQLNVINAKLDAVVKDLANKNGHAKTIFIREDDEESEVSSLSLHYEDVPERHQEPVEIEKLDFGLLSARSDKEEESSQKLSYSELPTAKSFANPMFSNASSHSGPTVISKDPGIPVEWMKLYPLNNNSLNSQFANNLLIYDHPKDQSTTPRASSNIPQLSERRAFTERAVQTTPSTTFFGASQTTQTTSRIDVPFGKTIKVVDFGSMRRMSQEDMKRVIEKVNK